MARASKRRRREWAELQQDHEGICIQLAATIEENCPATREDLQQAARLAILNVAERHDPGRGTKQAFARSAMVQAMTRERRRLTQKGRMKLGKHIDLPNERPEPVDAMIATEEAERLRWAIDQLPPIQKSLVCHFYGLNGYERMRIKELETRLEIGHHGEGTRMLKSAMDALRRMLVDPEDN